MKKINFIGQIYGTDGYSTHCRNLVNALYKHTQEIHLDVPKPHDYVRWSNDEEMKMLNNTFYQDGISIMVGMPPYWSLPLSENPKHFIGFLVWEGDRIPKYWLPYLLDKRVDQIWVPSEHVKAAILETFAPSTEHKDTLEIFIPDNFDEFESKIKVVPHGYDPNTYHPVKSDGTNSLTPIDEKFVFVANKGWSKGMDDRGGIQFLIQAYTQEFKPDEKVKLLLKINPAYNQPNWNFDEEIKKIGIDKDKKHPELQVSINALTLKQLNEIYNQSNVFISTQMADGFNLPGLEAMACGLPNIQPDFGGQMEYVDESNSWILRKGEMVDAKDKLYESVKWKKPDIEEIRKVMRYVFEHQDEIKAKSEKSLEKAKTMTWDDTASKAKAFLDELKEEIE